MTVNPLPADVLYAEVFPYVGPTTIGGPVSLVGWSNSIPDNADRLAQTSGGDGFVWSYEGYAWNSAFYTTTASDTGVSGLKFPSINPDAYPAVSFAVDLQPGWQANNVSGAYFAVQMGGADWYISQTPLPVDRNVGTYTTYQQGFDRSAIQWNTLTLDTTGATIGGPAAGNLSGNITGAGLVFVNSGAGTMNFDNFVISANAAPAIAPFIIYPPITQSTYAGGGASFAVKAGGTQPLSYYWQANQVTVSDGGRISGTRSNLMTIKSVGADDQVIYSVIVSNAAGTVDSIGLSVSGLTVSSVPAGLLYAESFPYVGPVPYSSYPLSLVGWASAIPDNPNRLFALDYAGNAAAYAYESSGPQATAFYTTTTMDTGASGLAFPTIGLLGASGLTFAVDIAPAFQATNVTAYVAVQISGGTWYVSSTPLPVNTSPDSGTYSTVSHVFSPTAANWKNLTLSGTGATIGSVAGADLSGNITGAGLVFAFTGTGGTFNFKNFQFTGTGGTIVTDPGRITIGNITPTTLTLNWTANPNVRLQSTTNLTLGDMAGRAQYRRTEHVYGNDYGAANVLSPDRAVTGVLEAVDRSTASHETEITTTFRIHARFKFSRSLPKITTKQLVMKNIKTIIAAGFAAVALIQGNALAQGNLLSNGNFNTGDLTGWWSWTADAANSGFPIATDTSFSSDGSPYLHLWNHGATGGDPAAGQSVDMAGGLQYGVSLAFRGKQLGRRRCRHYLLRCFLGEHWVGVGHGLHRKWH